jgi:hypothetical protein
MANFSNLPNPSSLLEYKGWKFLIFDAPTDANLDVYIKVSRSFSFVSFIYLAPGI